MHRLVGTKLILVYYFLRGIMDVVFPLVMHYEFRSREAGGSANGAGFQHHTCKWTGGACPNFAPDVVCRCRRWWCCPPQGSAAEC